MSISITESPEVYGVFETKQYDRSKRQQVYQQSEISSYQAGQRISFSMPPISSDFRDMYLELNVELNNITPEVNASYDVRSHLTTDYVTLAPDAGAFYLEVIGERLGPFAWNVAKGDIIDALNNFVQDVFPIKSVVYSLQAPQLPTDLFSASGSIIIDVEGFQTLDVNTEYDIRSCCSSLSAGGVRLAMSVDLTQEGVARFPQLEFDACSLLRRGEIEINAQTFSECDDINVLMTAILNKRLPVGWYNTLGRLENNTGSSRTWTGQRRFAIHLGEVFGILEHYFPLHLIPGIQFRINLYLEDANRCLVQESNIGQGSYTVFNPELHYHVLKLTGGMQQAFREKINGDGLTYGFRSYQNLTDTLVQNATEKDIITNYNFSRFTGSIAVMREQDYINDPSNDYKLSSTIRNSVGSYRLKIGTQYYPRDRVELLDTLFGNPVDVVEPLKEFTRFYNLESYGEKEPYCGLNYEANNHLQKKKIDLSSAKVPPSFIMAISTDPHQNENDQDRHSHSSGVDVSGQTNVSLELRNVSPASTNLINLFARYNAFAVLQRNQSVYIR